MHKKIAVWSAIIIIVAAAAGTFYFFRLYQNTPPIYQAPAPAATAPAANANTPSATVSSTETSQTPSARTYNVTVIYFSFNPGTITINKGDTVVWTNQDSFAHQVAGGSFNGPVMNQHQSYAFTFTEAGRFDYHCAIHPFMKGTIIVQ